MVGVSPAQKEQWKGLGNFVLSRSPLAPFPHAVDRLMFGLLDFDLAMAALHPAPIAPLSPTLLATCVFACLWFQERAPVCALSRLAQDHPQRRSAIEKKKETFERENERNTRGEIETEHLTYELRATMGSLRRVTATKMDCTFSSKYTYRHT